MEEERRVLEGQLAHLNARNELLFANQDDINRNYGHYLILRRAIARVTSQLDWIEDSMQSVLKHG